jgi:hypothetical protein
MKKFLTETMREVLPAYARGVSKGLTAFTLTATLICLAAVLGIIGGITGLQELGLAPFASYLIGAAVAGSAGFFLFKFNAPKAAEAHRVDDCRSVDT